MAFTHGKNTVVKLDNGAGVLTDISAFLNQADLERARETLETTVFGNTEKQFVPGLREASFSGSGFFDPSLDQILQDAITNDTATKTLEFGPEGDTAGKVKYSMEVWITDYSVSSGVGDMSTIEFELQATGAVTRGTF